MTGDRVQQIHLSDPTCGPSYCGEPVTIIEAPGDTRPVCQVCHRGAMKAVRGGWCPCASKRPQDCKPEEWPLSDRHGLSKRYLLAENARLRAQLDTVRELAEDAPLVPVHAGGGNLVNSKRMVSADKLRAALNQGGETNGE